MAANQGGESGGGGNADKLTLLASLSAWATQLPGITPSGRLEPDRAPKSQWGWTKALLHSVYDHPDAASVHAQFDRVLDGLYADQSTPMRASALFEVPHLELVVRVAGSVYLLWLAWTIARSGAPGQITLAQPRRFATGVLLLWSNPKAWAITLSAAGTFAKQVDGPIRLAALLGGAFLAGATSSQLLWASLGGAVGRRLTQPWEWRALNVTLAVLVIASVVPIWLE